MPPVLSLRELAAQVGQGSHSVAEVVEPFLSRAEHSTLNSFVTVTREGALQAAKTLDQRIARGEHVGKLAGAPIAVKDLFTTAGIATTAGSKVLKGYVPPYTATAVERLTREGAIVLGKTNCDEFAMGSSGENSAFGPTKNPWDTTRVPGGSSSGSAAAVAAGECWAALGTDTGGSIRQPAAFCGVVGLKPTYGRVPRWGVIAMTSSFDCPGPFARTVEDAALMLGVMAGHDERDATSSREPVPDYVAELAKPVKGLRVGVPKEFFAEGLHPAVREVVEQAVGELKKLGAVVTEVSLPTVPYALAAYYVICPSEVSANLARFDGMRYGPREMGAETLVEVYRATRGRLLGAEVKRRIMLGTYVLSQGYYDAYYRKAQAARAAIIQDFKRVFAEVDVLVTPTTPTTAFPIGSKAQDPLAMYLADVYTVPVNIAGVPAVSVPCGFVQGLPVGLQIIGQAFDEAGVLRLAQAYEQATPWHTRQPATM